MSNQRPPTLDPQAADRWARQSVAASPWLHEEVARRMQERLEWIKRSPQAWGHWQPLRGGVEAHALISRRYPRAACFAYEGTASGIAMARQQLSRPWWRPTRWTGGAIEIGPIPDGALQMLWANMALHMDGEPQHLMARWHRALAVDGFLMFSCLGPDTLGQLRPIYHDMGWPPPAHEFTDMHDWGDMLVQAGFAEPVMDMERITLSWETPQRLLAELRELGTNLHVQRFPGLRGRRWRSRLEEVLVQRLAGPDGRLALTFEIIYGHALKPLLRVRVSEHSAVSLNDMRAMLHGRQPDQG